MEYEVDYGTDTISASDAIARTNADLVQNATDTADAQKSQDTLGGQITRLQTVGAAFVAASGKGAATPPLVPK